MNLNPLVQKYLGSIVRTGLAFVGGYLVKAGWLSFEEMQELIIALTAILTPLAWSLYQKWSSQREAMTLGALKQGATLQDAKASIARGISAPASTGASDVPVLINTNADQTVKPRP